MLDITVDSLDFHYLRLIDESGQFQEYNLKEELAVNESNLLQEMLQQPSKYIYWASILEKIQFFQESSELELELLEARLDKQARADLEKPTKDSVEAYIKRTDDYRKAREKVMYYDYICKRILRIVKGFEQRKDMLQSYGKQIAEQKGYGSGAGSKIENLPSDIAAQSPFTKY